MKQPRTSDFDPSARPLRPSQPQARDLKSSMDDLPSIERAQSLTLAVPAQAAVGQTPREPVPPVRGVRDGADIAAVGTPGPVTRRKIKPRHPFDIYEDQLETLKQLSVEDRMRGGQGSMSAMVRTAIDDFIAKVRA